MPVEIWRFKSGSSKIIYNTGIRMNQLRILKIRLAQFYIGNIISKILLSEIHTLCCKSIGIPKIFWKPG